MIHYLNINPLPTCYPLFTVTFAGRLLVLLRLNAKQVATTTKLWQRETDTSVATGVGAAVSSAKKTYWYYFIANTTVNLEDNILLCI
jgi:hypothetical protein